MRAGDWIFATGHKALNAAGPGIDPRVTAAGHPSWSGPKLRREADAIFASLARVLEAGGSDVGHIVRVDQYYSNARAVELYHDARRAAIGKHIPPSTSILQPELLLPGQEIEVQMIAARRRDGFAPKHISRDGHEVHWSSGYSIALAAGDYVFLAGMLADSLKFGEGLALEARAPANHLWKGMPIRLETKFTMEQKVIPALAAAGCSLDDVVKCQVYLRDPEDFGPFHEVWANYFPRARPSTSVIPMANPGLVIDTARIEINTLAVRPGGNATKQIIDAGVFPMSEGASQAVRAGDFLFISGLMAIDADGVVEAARIDPRQPRLRSSIREQMEVLLANAEKLCAAAGTSLANVVRVQQFHTNLDDFLPAYDVWAHHLGDRPLPFSAVGVPFLPAPGCSVMLDLWVYCGR
jgi:enamine deaminase RidA (YjgF/YER057c/UK114 family)